MRLIDADKIIGMIETTIKDEGGNIKVFSCNDVIKIINTEPTAFDGDKVVEQLEERTEYLRNCKKYGNQTKEEKKRSCDTMMMYEVAELVEDLIDIVKGGLIDG